MKRRTAFTLIELLVVVSIIGLLAALLLPSLRGARAQAKVSVCAGNLRQLGIAIQGYLGEHNDRFPHASHSPSFGPAPLSDLDEPIYIADVLDLYVGRETNVFHCSDDKPGRFSREPPNAGLSWFQSERSSYQYQTFLAGRTIVEFANRIEQHRDQPVPENMIWIMRGYHNFHGKAGASRNRNYLYVDGHVSDYES